MTTVDEAFYVITRTGKRELLSLDKITERNLSIINRPPKIEHVNAYDLTLEVSKGLKRNMSTSEIDEFAIDRASSMGISNPYYLEVASRLAIDNHQKNTLKSFYDKMKLAYLYVNNHNKSQPLLNSKFFKFVETYQNDLENMIDYS